MAIIDRIDYPITENDYLELARKLLADPPLDACEFSLENPEPGSLVLTVKHEEPLKAFVAASLLKEFWPYDWMIVNVVIAFRAAV